MPSCVACNKSIEQRQDYVEVNQDPQRRYHTPCYDQRKQDARVLGASLFKAFSTGTHTDNKVQKLCTLVKELLS